MIDQSFLRAGTKMICRKGLHYGGLDDSVGYLRIRSFGNYARHDDMAALEGCLDVVLADDKMKSLVIDMRLSFGGSDELGLAIASRLTDRPYLAYSVQARSGATTGDGWTAAQPIMIQPSSRRVFRGPIAMLTGPVTMSAAETFLESLMGRDPPVIRIGENTQGVFCDVLDRHLPNGWTFGLPNAVYVAGDGKTYDVTGIPPDIRIPVFTDAQIAGREDPALQMAKRVLR
jgi:C-terminal processing protease CtpA/Prc